MPQPPLTVWILGNQLLENHPALKDAAASCEPDQIRVLMIENQQLIQQRNPTPGKLILVLSAMRHYARSLEQAGFLVDYRQASTFTAGIRDHLQEHQPGRLITMAASDYQGRLLQEKILPSRLPVPLTVLPNTHFLIGRYNPYPDPAPDQTVLMEYFYRRMRRHFNVLLDADGNPSGGEWNYDQENRMPLPEGLHPPAPLHFSSDEITRQVRQDLIPKTDRAGDFLLAVTRNQALQALEDFLTQRLENFGSYEDAMTVRSGVLYHSKLSPYLNLGLLEPLEVIQAVEEAYRQDQAPINAAEGFVRQVLGWREYIYWQYWRRMPALQEANAWGAQRPLPDFFWTGKTTMNCLATVLKQVHQTGYNHHIERLMILSNFCTLAGIQPQEVLNWFMSSYIDAYPWVMVPNVIAMGLHADGGSVGTKPYISSANYINKMSDYCKDCSYRHRKRTGEGACPYNYLYWNFLLTHQEGLGENPRMALSLNNLKYLDDEERQAVRSLSRSFLTSIELGKGA